MLEQVSFFVVVDAHVQVIERPGEKIIYFPGDIQNVANPKEQTLNHQLNRQVI